MHWMDAVLIKIKKNKRSWPAASPGCSYQIKSSQKRYHAAEKKM